MKKSRNCDSFVDMIALHLVGLAFVALSSDLSAANEIRNCRDLFANANKNTQVLIKEIAELYLATNQKNNTVVASAGNTIFESRLAELAARIGKNEARLALRVEIARIKSDRKAQDSTSAEGGSRKAERKTFRSNVNLTFKPTLIEDIEGRIQHAKVDSNGFPDGSIEFQRSEHIGTERLYLTEDAPYFEFKSLEVPETPVGSSDGLIHDWTIRKVGSREIGIGSKGIHGPTSRLWIWDVSKGPKALWSLPRSAYAVEKLEISPNGRYLISADTEGKIHRLDLDTGIVKDTSDFIGRAGAWVRDDGSIILFLKSSEIVELDANLTLVGKTSAGPSFPRDVGRVVPSPDQSQVLLFDSFDNVRLADLKTGVVTPRLFSVDKFGKIVWFKEMVWVQYNSVMTFISRNLSQGSESHGYRTIALPKSAVSSHGPRLIANLNVNPASPSFRKGATINLDGATGIPFSISEADFHHVGGGDGWNLTQPVSSHDGRMFAMPGTSSSVLIFNAENGHLIGFINPKAGGEIKSAPRWSPNDLSLMVEVEDSSKPGSVHTEIWAIDGDLM